MAIRDILVTGGAGYIGSHLVDALVAREYRVTVLDNLEPQVHRSGVWPTYANAQAEYVKGDVRDRSVFEPLVLRSNQTRSIVSMRGKLKRAPPPFQLPPSSPGWLVSPPSMRMPNSPIDAISLLGRS